VEFTKSEKKQLRELAEEVYESEASGLLKELDEQFSRWRQGEILSSELLREIHYFHQHQSRELWSMYQSLPEALVVERGVAHGLLAESKVPAPLLAKLNIGAIKEK